MREEVEMPIMIEEKIMYRNVESVSQVQLPDEVNRLLVGALGLRYFQLEVFFLSPIVRSVPTHR